MILAKAFTVTGIFPWQLEVSLTNEQIAWLHAIDETIGLNPFDRPAARLSQLVYACAGQKSESEQWLPPDVYTAAAIEQHKAREDYDPVTAALDAFALAITT